MVDQKVKVAVVGCGSIGAMKPDEIDYPGGENILTWAHAISDSPDCDLVALVDNNMARATLAGEKWKVPSHTDIFDIKEKVDLFVIAVPEQFHKPVYKQCLEKTPLAIMLEKPAGVNGQDAVDLIEIGFANTVVDYTRRFNPLVQEIRNKLLRGDYGKVYSARFYYNRGMLRDGCHAIDMIRYFFNEILDITSLINPAYKISDYSVFDPAVSLAFKTERCPTVQMIGLDGRAYSIFEFEIMTEKVRIVFCDHWMKIRQYRPEKEPVFGNYNWMPSSYQEVETNLSKELLTNPLADVLEVIKGRKRPECSLYDAFKVHATIHQIFNVLK